ncbi:MAG TPA: hypothetical protein VHV49_15685 [Pseudonocardiaceae bacterium]|jgi:dTMP kinase|nr:hypothetical protein [Pseudonocardiaceae bacterium]
MHGTPTALGSPGYPLTCRHHWLDQRGHRAPDTTEPSHPVLGELACHRTNAYHGRALACLVAADRYHHLAAEIRPALDDGKIVLCDRYVAFSYVLQRLGGVPLSVIQALNSDAAGRRPGRVRSKLVVAFHTTARKIQTTVGDHGERPGSQDSASGRATTAAATVAVRCPSRP